MPIDPERLRHLNSAAPRQQADYVLYRMRANRRIEFNHALAYAAELANSHGLPLLVYEDLAFDDPHAGDRFHTFVLEGAADNAREAAAIRAGYFFLYRSRPEEPCDVLRRLASRARTVVTDDYPGGFYFSPDTLGTELADIQCVAVDSSCIVPMSLREKREYGAYTIRPRIHRELPRFLRPLDPIRLARPWRDGVLPHDLARLRTQVTAASISSLVAAAAIPHAVPPSTSHHGGSAAASRRLGLFLEHRLRRYAGEASKPSLRATSELSPHLHFGHISSLEIALAARQYAEENSLMAGEFLEELIVRRELAFNFARFTPNRTSLDCLPDWCRRTLAAHASDPRPHIYTPEQFECAQTHDVLWNATQRELALRGTIHGYYRMYWGKKIIEWSPTYEEALGTMIHLHDVYALDGRDPNTYTNILWCFGLHDRPWNERPVFGQLRYMSFEGMRRKTDVDAYVRQIAWLQRHGEDGEPERLV